MSNGSFVEERQGIVEVVWSVPSVSWLERNSKIVAQGVDNDYNGLVKGLWVPAASVNGARLVAVGKIERRDSAFGLVVQHQSCEEEAAEEEVKPEYVEKSLLGRSGAFFYMDLWAKLTEEARRSPSRAQQKS